MVGSASPLTSRNQTINSQGGLGKTPPNRALAAFRTSCFVDGGVDADEGSAVVVSAEVPAWGVTSNSSLLSTSGLD